MSGQYSYSRDTSRLLATIPPMLAVRLRGLLKRQPLTLTLSAKLFFLLMLLVNFRSLPFAWHSERTMI